jgi:hypothetical protein
MAAAAAAAAASASAALPAVAQRPNPRLRALVDWVPGELVATEHIP